MNTVQDQQPTHILIEAYYRCNREHKLSLDVGLW